MKATKYKKALGALDEDKSYRTEEALEVSLKEPKRRRGTRRARRKKG